MLTCRRCQLIVEETASMVYQCKQCNILIDEHRGVCIFKVGPYHITLFDDHGFDIAMYRTQIMKGLSSIYLNQELPIEIQESELDKIWKHHKEN